MAGDARANSRARNGKRVDSRLISVTLGPRRARIVGASPSMIAADAIFDFTVSVVLLSKQSAARAHGACVCDLLLFQ